MKNNCIEPRTKTPIRTGIIPAGNVSHINSLSIKYTTADIKLNVDKIKPKIVATLNPIFVYDVNESIAPSLPTSIKANYFLHNNTSLSC